MRTISLFAALALLVLPACDSNSVDDTKYEVHDTFDDTFDISEQFCVRVEAINGTVTIAGKDGLDVVQVAGERTVKAWSRAEAEEHLDDLEVRVDVLRDEYVVRTVQPTGNQGPDYEVNYEIEVPSTWEVIVTQANGIVDVSDVSGDATIAMANGEISYRSTVGAGQSVDLSLGNGVIEALLGDDSSASIEATLANGFITTHGLMLQNAVTTSTSLVATIGAGEGDIILSLANGTILLADRD